MFSLYLCLVSLPGTPWPSSAPKDRNQGMRDWGILEAIPQNHADQSMPSETDDLNTGEYIIHS